MEGGIMLLLQNLDLIWKINLRKVKGSFMINVKVFVLP